MFATTERVPSARVRSRAKHETRKDAYAENYHVERNHQGPDNRLIDRPHGVFDMDSDVESHAKGWAKSLTNTIKGLRIRSVEFLHRAVLTEGRQPPPISNAPNDLFASAVRSALRCRLRPRVPLSWQFFSLRLRRRLRAVALRAKVTVLKIGHGLA